MESGLLQDSDWAPLDGEVCRVVSLTDVGFTKGKPYASVQLESPQLPALTTGFVNHKLDYQHLVEAFTRKQSEPNSEVLLVWAKQSLKQSAQLFAAFMPGMWVMLCPAKAYELMIDQSFAPELGGLERHHAQRPIAEWRPSVIE
jgi:hypothetical protein